MSNIICWFTLHYNIQLLVIKTVRSEYKKFRSIQMHECQGYWLDEHE